jgi:hypothetical protein
VDLVKLKHPAWLGLVLPLAIASTFTPGTVRGVSLIAAILAVA